MFNDIIYYKYLFFYKQTNNNYWRVCITLLAKVVLYMLEIILISAKRRKFSDYSILQSDFFPISSYHKKFMVVADQKHPSSLTFQKV